MGKDKITLHHFHFEGHNIGSENVAQKIIELSRKNRELNVEVESGKTRNKQLQNEIQKLENEVCLLSCFHMI